MSDRPTITTLPAGAKYDTSTLNANFTALRNVLDKVIGRSGTSGSNNAATGDLDMDGNTIRNALFDRSDVIGMEWESAWVTATAYTLNDVVFSNGSSYICIIAHTSGTFSTDLAALKWELLAQKGDTGAAGADATGDVVGPASSTDSSLARFDGTTGILLKDGAVIGTDVQAYDAQLADIAALAVTDGNVIVGDGANWVAESGATARASLGIDVKEQLLVYVSGQNFAGGSTNYLSPGKNETPTVESFNRALAARTFTVVAMYCEVSAAPSSGQSVTITFRNNGGDSSVTATISNTATTASDAVNTATVTAGNPFSIKTVHSASAANSTVKVTLLITIDESA